jgi:hypothetical protein
MIDRVWAAVAGAVAVFLAAACLYLYLDRQSALKAVSEAQRVLAEERAAWATERQRLTEAALTELERARQVEAQWREKQREVTSNAQEQVRAAAADAARARSAADVLRKRAEALASQCTPYRDEASRDPAAALGGATAESPGAVLAELLGRLASTAGELAAIADARGAAGAACEKAYGVLK